MKEKYREVSYSKTIVSELMIPAYANFGGKIHGGILLSLMDKVAYACASKHAGEYCVTVSVENVDFIAPVEVGEMVTLTANIVYVGQSSMVVRIYVVAENFLAGSFKTTNTSYFTMVAKDKAGKPIRVPGLILENIDEKKYFLEVIKRKELKITYKKELQNSKIPLFIDTEDKLLEKERCQLSF